MGRALLAASLSPLLLLTPAVGAQEPPVRALLVLLPPMSYEEALRWPVLARLGAAGGVGLMTTRPAPGRTAEETLIDGGAQPGTIEAALGDRLLVARVEGEAALESLLEEVLVEEGEVLVLAAPPRPSPAMRERGDDVVPLVAARGRGEELRDPEGPIGGLASDTTRRRGLVTNLDVAPTLFRFLGEPVPAAMPGAPLRVEGQPPGILHQRYLGVRRLRVPVQVGALALGMVVLVGGAAFLLAGGRSPLVGRLLAGGGLTAVALPAAFLPAGDLPRIAWGTVLPVAAVVTALMVGGGMRLGRRDPSLPVAVVGAASASILVLDALLGWRASMLALFGGTAFEGARLFGLRNVYAGVLLAGSVLTAAHLPPRGGVGLLLAAGLFAGLPWVGSNLGAALTMFAAAGLWYGLRVRRRLGWSEAAIAAGVAVAGTAAVVLVHALLAAGDTHVARLAAETGRSGPPALLEALGRRLAIAVRVTSEVPVAWLVVPALPALAVVAWRRWGYLGRDPAWRDAVLVIAVAGLVGFAVNDTGIGVGGVALAFAAVALGYPMLEERWRSG